MKKRNNKTIVLIVIGIFFVVLFGIFILNYSKDDASFSILEKKWISDNTSNIIDVSVYNDVPVYGNKGKGVIFDLLNDFTDKYKINFNKVSYLSSSSSNLKMPYGLFCTSHFLNPALTLPFFDISSQSPTPAQIWRYRHGSWRSL